MKAFHDCLSDCGLEAHGYIGVMFTRRRGKIKERLDRAMADVAWNNLFPQRKAINDRMTKSVHISITINT
jgi:hypothetical protein